jgi:hypothetical protein
MLVFAVGAVPVIEQAQTTPSLLKLVAIAAALAGSEQDGHSGRKAKRD